MQDPHRPLPEAGIRGVEATAIFQPRVMPEQLAAYDDALGSIGASLDTANSEPSRFFAAGASPVDLASRILRDHPEIRPLAERADERERDHPQLPPPLLRRAAGHGAPSRPSACASRA